MKCQQVISAAYTPPKKADKKKKSKKDKSGKETMVEVEVHESSSDVKTCNNEAQYELNGVRYCVFHHNKATITDKDSYSIEEYEPEEPEPIS